MTKWPADRVERCAIDGLVPYANNARTHSESQIAQIAASMREWGWTNPVLIDEAGGIIAGHGRVLAAKTLGLAEVPVMIAEGWSEAQRAVGTVLNDDRADWRGTTVIAAEMERRVCLGVELNPAYCDLIVKRWQDFAGGEARIEATGQSFQQVDEARWQETGNTHNSAASYEHGIEALRAAAS